MSYNRRTQAALVDHLECADRAIEVGIGRRPAVAAELTDRGTAVTATDIHERSVPEEIRFVCDDITDPDLDLYDGADVIYALNLPQSSTEHWCRWPMRWVPAVDLRHSVAIRQQSRSSR
ncbi:MAG: UPF0146 family protein [Natrialbaceae archaeon]|nr:UPF0146 family protein [Natrialbaceae archaeon]